MDERLRSRCELFIENRNRIKKEIGWQNALLYPICASIYAQSGDVINCDRIRECKKIIKKHTGIFSNFRGTTNIVLATLLSKEAQPERQFEYTLEVYDQLKKEFSSTLYLTMTANIIASLQKDKSAIQPIVRKAAAIYDGVKKQHRFITSSEDSGQIALLALSNKSEYQIITEVERCFTLLKPNFFSSNAVQALSFVLALSDEDPKIKCQRAIDIYQNLKAANCKYGSGLELAILGVLAMEDIDIRTTVATIHEISDFLLASKGFGNFGVGRSQRIMYATMLLMNDIESQKHDTTMNTAAITSITSSIIAQQVAVAAAAASAAAANSANN